MNHQKMGRILRDTNSIECSRFRTIQLQYPEKTATQESAWESRCENTLRTHYRHRKEEEDALFESYLSKILIDCRRLL